MGGGRWLHWRKFFATIFFFAKNVRRDDAVAGDDPLHTDQLLFHNSEPMLPDDHLHGSLLLRLSNGRIPFTSARPQSPPNAGANERGYGHVAIIADDDDLLAAFV